MEQKFLTDCDDGDGAGEVQGDLMMTWAEMPRSPGHVFYDRLQSFWPRRASTFSSRRRASRITPAVGPARPEDPCDLVADKGYHSRDVLKDLDEGPWKTRISEPRPSKGYSR